jgi:hypothetical protein
MSVSLRSSSMALGIALIAFGAIGMLICFMFLWSSDLKDIIGAGFGFLAGAVMLGAGSVSLALAGLSGCTQNNERIALKPNIF